MTRGGRLVRNVLLGAVGTILVLVVAAVVVVRTAWFGNYVRGELISSIADATGGRTEVGSFQFDEGQLRATVRNFVIHGTEAAGAKPFLSIGTIDVDLRILPGLRHLYSITFLGVNQLAVNVTMQPDGGTNIPSPKQKSSSSGSALQTVVDLAVNRFVLQNGELNFLDVHQTLSLDGRNLQARLDYTPARQAYDGEFGIQPVYVVNGRNTPVEFSVRLPVTLAKDRIEMHQATISSAISRVTIDGAITGSTTDMKAPDIAVHLQGRIAGSDLVRVAGLRLPNEKEALPDLELDTVANASNQSISVKTLHVSFGKSSLEGSGALKDPRGNGALQVRTELDLSEFGRLIDASPRSAGTVAINASAKLDSANNYTADGNIATKDVSFTEGKRRFSGIGFASAFHADPHNLRLDGLRLNAFGGQFDGNAGLENFEKYSLAGSVRNLNIDAALKSVGENAPYEGTISGPIHLTGDMKAAGTSGMAADARLEISPGKRGIPVSGKINARFSGAADDVIVENSFIALPRTLMTVSGSVAKRLNFTVSSKDLHDLLAAVPWKNPPQMALSRGSEADFKGSVTGAFSKPNVSGHLAIGAFSVEGRAFDSAAADLAASSALAKISNVSLTRNTMQAHADASLALHDWSPVPHSPLAVNATLMNGDLADVAVLAGESPAGYSGALSAAAQVHGTYANPIGSAMIQADQGMIHDEPFNRIQLQVSLTDQLVTLPAAYIDTPAGTVNLSGDFRHPSDSFSTGQAHAHLQSGSLDLSRMTTLTKSGGPSSGRVALNADVTGTLQKAEPAFLLTTVNADVSANGLRMNGANYGDLKASAHTNGTDVAWNLTSNFAGSNIHGTGTTQLANNYPTKANLEIANLPVDRTLAAAGESSLGAHGNLTASIEVNGPVNDPQGSLRVDLTKAALYGEPLDRVEVRGTWLDGSADVSQLEIQKGPARLSATAHYDHPPGDLRRGQARFTLEGSRIDLARIATVQKYRPGLGGTFEINSSGSADVGASNPEVLLTSLNANVSANGIAAGGKQFGDLKLTANTPSKGMVMFALDSDLAGAAIHGNGSAMLNAQYPVDARLSFRNVQWTNIASLMGRTDSGPAAFEATTDGDVTVRGPLMEPNQLSGTVDISKLTARTIPRTKQEKPVTIANDGPIQIAMDRGQIRIAAAHVTGPKSDFQATGTASIAGASFGLTNLNLNVRTTADLGVLQSFNPDLYALGTVALTASVRGDLQKPLVNGQLTVQDAALNLANVPVGISKANGSIVFNGNTAQIKTLTADSGGGHLSLTGFAAYAEVMRFGLKASASNVRVRVQEGVSVTADASVDLTGTSDNSRITGLATLTRVSYAAQSDFGSILTRAAPPVQTPYNPSALLSNMKLDVRVRNSPAMPVQSSLSQDLQADIDLRIRGTAENPGMQGRITITEGQLVFFGNTYTVNTGTIAFYDLLRIEPVLDVSLQAQVQGVKVTVQVTGPVENMKLTYTSDPPLQFQEIISLLAAGSTPTSDPTLLANQPAPAQQGLQQMGESAALGQAVANPVANQLQRVFGVTQLKIDPTFTSGTVVPTARLALQQRIANNLTFTYVQAVDQPNSTIIRMEWAFSPQYSAVATRDQNGIFSLILFYKREIR